MSDVMLTPGPWTASNASGENVIGPNVVWEVEDAHGMRLATVHTMGIGVDTGKANGELMAAAPDMLDMLRQGRELMPFYDCDGCTRPGEVRARTDWDEEAEALIAKATGESA